jgi:bla regulator protein blaR1
MTSLFSIREFLALAGDHLWQSTLFAAVAALVAFILRRHSPSLRYWVWFAASAKFLIPFAALVAIGGYSSWRTIDIVPYREGPVLIETVGQPFSQDTVRVGTPKQRAGAGSAVMSRLPAVLLLLWAAGGALFLARSLRQWWRVRQIARDAVPLTAGREVDALRSLERSAGSSRALPLRCTDTFLEPGIFGIVRPVLLWPRAISERFTNEQMEAVLAHELCHLRRGDNLAALFHLVVQTVFWFHPLSWWIGKQLITERERACDEEVIRRGSERETYAESILKTCQFFVESPLACVSGVTGSDLKKRIEEIMTKDAVSTPGAPKRALLAAVGVVAFVTPVAVGALNPPPQTREVPAPATLPAFDAVSIRPNITSGPGGRSGGAMQPQRFVVQNATLKAIIRRAYGAIGRAPGNTLDLLDQQVAGGPEWLTTDKFDITATTIGPTADAQMRLMVQRMLADRFQLKAHWEKREMPVYLLTIARPDGRPGPGLTLKSEADCARGRGEGPRPMPQPGEPMPPPNCGGIQFGPGQLIAGGVPVEWLGSTFTNVPVITGIDRPVLDRTGLKGTYAFDLKFAPPQNTNPNPDRPQFMTALQEQLGLRLEAARAPVDMLVIDSVERPSEN